jgi:hypothetical protein
LKDFGLGASRIKSDVAGPDPKNFNDGKWKEE